MKFLKTTIATLALTGFAGQAMAQDTGAYGTLGVSTYEFDTYNITGRLGYNLNEYFGIEGEGSIGVIGEDDNGVEVDTEWDLGAYAVARLPLSNQFEAFVRGGYTVVSVEATVAGVTDSDEVDGYAVGGGVQYNLNDRSGLRLGYTYKDGDLNGVDLDADVWDVSYVRKF
ncbi:opacity protein-like surface antigen [Litorimonas taeanensis]|uniref:Opacity protein-like surface antigen n=1 Tax=Litorimonas taeanensis TaxID=568099 RepID=A0A420WDI7_9PROT|nr:porin family protein [Litorimonas taeanensis]RKQ69071.1 opacity protein-like surface antigen [Litorimonas taeanensis]